MEFYKIVKQEMITENLTQSELAQAANCSQVMISNYLAGVNEMSADVKLSIAKYINTPRLNRALSNDFRLGVLNIDMLNNVDTNVITILDSIIEESNECCDASKALKRIMKNKMVVDDLDTTDKKLIFENVVQLVDLYFALDLLVVVMADRYELSLTKLERETNEKMKTKGYIRRENND